MKNGDGGFVGVSGKVQRAYAALADLRVPVGAAGTLLLDPKNCVIGFNGEMTPDALEARLGAP